MSGTGEDLANAWLRNAMQAIVATEQPRIDRLWSDQEEAKHNPKTWIEPPVDIVTFNRDFLGRDNLTEFHIDAMRAFAGESGDVWDETFKVIAFCWGQGAGKGFTAEILCAYTMYRLLLLSNPHTYFNIDQSSFFDILNISFVGGDQAKQVFFDRMKNVIRCTKDPANDRNWFEQRGVDLRDNGIGDIREQVIQLPRNIRARCLPFTKVSWEGSSVILGIVDEPSRAVGSPPMNLRGRRVFSGLLDNTTGRFQRKGKVVTFSYPEAQDDDLIMELWRSAKVQFTTEGRRTRIDGDPDIYVSRGATYDVNPRVKKEDFDNRRKIDPEGIEAHIECNPPHSRTGFYRQYPNKIADSFTLPDRDDVIGYDVYPLEYKTQKDGQLVITTYTAVKLLWARGDREYRVLGGDPGESNDVFSLAIARTKAVNRSIQIERVRKRERQHAEMPPGIPGQCDTGEWEVERDVELKVIDRMVIVDGMIEIVPIRYQRIDQNTGRPVTDTYPISFESVRDFILILKQHFPRLDTAAFDRWQSSQLIEALIRAGINAESLAFTNQQQYALYVQHRALAYNDLIRCLPSPTKIGNSPRSEKEFTDLQEVLPGRKVDHKVGGSKDTADAIVIAAQLALDQDIRQSGCLVLV
jgi:hypothetical protein